jgi:hypothetical protein
MHDVGECFYSEKERYNLFFVSEKSGLIITVLLLVRLFYDAS